MSNEEKQYKEWISSFGNKVIGVIAGGVCIGLFMTFMFMTSIQATMEHNNDNVNLKFMAVDKQFDVVGKRIDKVEDKVDGVYHYTVPQTDQVQEPRKKLPLF